jgi:hypothetical protein
MAGFKTHITVSSILGVGYGAAAFAVADMPWPTCALAGGLCGVSGMLPDLDSGPGVPLRESMAFAAAVVPMMLVHRFQHLGLSPELIILAGAAIYLGIRFGVAELLRRYTVHRGMFHSLPAAVIFGEIAFLIFSGEDLRVRLYLAGAVVAGYLSHLVLDEFYSLEWQRGMLHTKHSFGTAVKLFGDRWWPNISTYLKLGVLTFVAMKEPGWMSHFYHDSLQKPLHETAEKAADTLWR